MSRMAQDRSGREYAAPPANGSGHSSTATRLTCSCCRSSVLFCCFFLYPLGQSVVLSLYRSVGPRQTRFVGLDNYAFLLRDPLFWLSVANTVLFAFLFLLFQVPLSLGLALLLEQPADLVPRLVPLRVFCLLPGRQRLRGGNLHAAAGPADRADQPGHRQAAAIGRQRNQLDAGTRASPCRPSCWPRCGSSMGQAMIYFLAALQAVDRELYEAAEVDGAGRWAGSVHVTLPGIRPVLVYLVLVGTIYALQMFELPYVFFQGFGPRFAGMTVVGYLFMNGFLAGDIGYAAAAGWVLFLMISVVAFVQLKVSGATREL